jgi:homoserine kinase
MSWRLRVPASSANLGPGFDTLGVALGVYLTCRFRTAEDLRIRVAGRDSASISTAEDNLIWQTARAVARDLGETLPCIQLDIENEIPIGKGLGSSAAALTAGVLIADRLLSLNWAPNRVLEEAARIEGHPDNVAACVLGSIVASAIDTEGVARTVRLPMPQRYNIAVVVPDFPLSTKAARAVLPASYSRQDTIFNVQRSALLIAALATGTTTAFPAALEDRLHQPYRCALIPGLEEILKLRAAGLLGCSLSGAGPSVLVFYERGGEQVCDLVSGIFAAHGHRSETLWTCVDAHGSQIMEDQEPWT